MTLRLRTPRIVLGVATLAVVMTLGCEAPLPTATDADQAGAATARLAAKKTGATFAPACTSCVVALDVKTAKDGTIPLQGVDKKQQDNSDDGPKLQVIVLGTGEFDMGTLDLSTVLIGDATTIPATPVWHNGKESNDFHAKFKDFDKDGNLDVELFFSLREMWDRENVSSTTTTLCLVGAGDGYQIASDGCPGGGTGGFTLTTLFPWGASPDATPANTAVWVGQIQPFVIDSNDPTQGYPGWTTVGLDVLTSAVGRWANWRNIRTPVASEGTAPTGWLWNTCGLTTSTYVWANKWQLLVRRDVTVPAGSTNLKIQFLVDDDAKVFVNGTEVTSGFQTAQYATCASYDTVATVAVPDSLLSPDGVNKIAVWARDSAGYANYFDMKMTAFVPN